FVDDHARVGVVHVRADRVGGPQVDPDDFPHESPDSRRRENVAGVECRARGPAGEGTKKSRRRAGVPGAGVEPALPWGKRLLRPPCLTNSTTRAAHPGTRRVRLSRSVRLGTVARAFANPQGESCWLVGHSPRAAAGAGVPGP